jgi:hypothetical protein
MELGLLAVNEEHGLTMFEKRLRRKKFGSEKREVTRGFRNSHMSGMIYLLLLGRSKQGGCCERVM